METRDVTALFDERIRHVFKGKEELTNFFLKHERKKIVIENTQTQIRLAELGRGNKFDIWKLKLMVNSIADFFCRTALTQKEQTLMTAAQKAMFQADQSMKEQAEGLAKEIMVEVPDANT